MKQDSINYTNLVKEAKNGNPEAFYMIYQTTNKKVYQVCRRIMRNDDSAEDMTSAAYEQLVKKISQIREPEKVLNWLEVTARRFCLSEKKSSAAQVTPIEEIYDSAEAQGQIMIAGSQADDTEKVENDIYLQWLMQALSKEEAAVIKLFYFDGYRESEIAEELQIPVGTVKSRKFSAIQKMRKKAEGVELAS